MSDMKACSRCKRILPLIEFHRNHDKPHSRCVVCAAVAANSKRAARFGVDNTLTSDEVWMQFEKQGRRCFWCRCDCPHYAGSHIDHLISMSVGGGNIAVNVVLACFECNIKKGTNDPYRWVQRRSWSIDRFPLAFKRYYTAHLKRVTADTQKLLNTLRRCQQWMESDEMFRAAGIADKPSNFYQIILSYRLMNTDLVESRSEGELFNVTFFYRYKGRIEMKQLSLFDYLESVTFDHLQSAA